MYALDGHVRERTGVSQRGASRARRARRAALSAGARRTGRSAPRSAGSPRASRSTSTASSSLHVGLGHVEPVVSRSRPSVGSEADRRLDGLGLAGHALEHPLEHPAVLAEPGPQEAAVVVLAEPVDEEDLRQLVGVGVLADRRASARSSRPCCSRRTAASRTGRSAARRPRRLAAAVVSEAMIEPRNTPCSQSKASVTSGTVVRAAAAEEDRRDRHARRVLPLGRDRRALRRPAR